ncbi:DDE transposase family protein [Orientia tsutsugamushi str. Gilliam]|uniref:DDE transposase family protein n=1 Tax=Orientia tsutsugamushi str. Gilliam TaxID=1359184 RepID=A0A2U3R0E4_ORITS|nr:DDE transposase family protein [Orientia tsutsugamushi str. Gilliam]
MKFDQIKELGDEKFRRLTGVRNETFSKMVDILRKADGLK